MALQQEEDMDLIGPWELKGDFLDRIENPNIDVVIIADEDPNSEDSAKQINRIMHSFQNPPVICVGLTQNIFYVIVTVKDDGRGFFVPAVEQNEHFGLQIMQVRAAHIQGKVSVESEPGLGIKITLTWPEEQLQQL